MAETVYEFTADDIKGHPVALSQYRGRVLLIVNVASKCGFTYQYEGLETMYRKYMDKGLIVLGFPANNFLRQEPGTNEQIAQFCSLTYSVTFPMFSKISVKGKDIHPLYAFLTDSDKHPEYGGKITWNFNKFLIDRTGHIIGRFDSRVKPEDDTLVRAVEMALR
jgi:glutathione peroxidase